MIAKFCRLKALEGGFSFTLLDISGIIEKTLGIICVSCCFPGCACNQPFLPTVVSAYICHLNRPFCEGCVNQGNGLQKECGGHKTIACH